MSNKVSFFFENRFLSATPFDDDDFDDDFDDGFGSDDFDYYFSDEEDIAMTTALMTTLTNKLPK